MKTQLISLFAASLLTACAVGPDYRAPDPGPTAIHNAAAPGFIAEAPAAVWWKQFDDPELNALIEQALTANLDLRIAVDHVRQARALFVEQEFDYGPHVPMQAGYAHSKEQQPGFGNDRIDAESYSLGFDASWEIDLFGHVRRSVEAARADLGAQQATLADAQISVAAEVARNYFELRGTQKRLEVARRNLSFEQQTQQLTQVRYDAGRVTELDVQRSLESLKATEASIPPLEAAERQSTYRLAVLLGQRPGSLDEALHAAEVPTYAKALPIGDASNALRNRPDVRAAERQLAAATARVGVATAELFPRVNVTGFVGFLSGDLGTLFNANASSDSRAWSIAPTVSWAAFDLGSVRARLRASKAGADAAAANYEKVVLGALEETEGSFVVYGRRQAQLASLMQRADAARRATAIAEIQYREGVADYLALLDAQRAQLDAEDAVAQTEAAVNVDVVAIYKALGGLGQTPDAPINVATTH